MNQNPYLKQYQKNTVETATKEELFLLLFNALIKFISKAKEGMETKNIEQIHNNIIKAQNILYEFMRTLDFTVDPKLAENLKNIYQYNVSLLLKANIKKDMAALEESYKLLYDLREAWKQAILEYKNKKGPEYVGGENNQDDEHEEHNYAG